MIIHVELVDINGFTYLWTELYEDRFRRCIYTFRASRMSELAAEDIIDVGSPLFVQGYLGPPIMTEVRRRAMTREDALGQGVIVDTIDNPPSQTTAIAFVRLDIAAQLLRHEAVSLATLIRVALHFNLKLGI